MIRPTRDVFPAGERSKPAFVSKSYKPIERCDRILWKTTVIPDPVSKNEVIQDSAARPQTRVSQLLDAFRSPSRNLPESSTPKHSASPYLVSGKREARKLWSYRSIVFFR